MKQINIIQQLSLAIFLVILNQIHSFGSVKKSITHTKIHATNNQDSYSSNEAVPLSRRQLFSFTKSLLLSSPILLTQTNAAKAEDSKRAIKPCPSTPTSNKNCISTSNIKQLENYLPPWTFEVSPDEAFARIKGVLVSDSTFSIVDTDEYYIKAETRRSGGVIDVLEFIVNPEDKVVVFRSGEKGIDDGDDYSSLPDFGANKKRLESIRKKGAVFDLMGSGLTMDTYYGSPQGGNGPLGQLKAFYGFQSGRGFEEVILD